MNEIEKHEKIIPYDDRLHEKLYRNIYERCISEKWINLIIEVLAYYGFIYFRVNKERKIIEIEWHCKKCNEKIIIDSLIVGSRIENVLAHTQLNLLREENYHIGKIWDTINTSDIYTVVHMFYIPMYNDEFTKAITEIEENKNIDYFTQISLYNHMKIYISDIYGCIICGMKTIVNNDHSSLFIDKHHLHHIIKNMNDRSLKCTGSTGDIAAAKK